MGRDSILLEQFLETDSAKTNFYPMLKIIDLSRLACTCKSMHTFFKDDLDYMAAEKLLELVKQADWSKVERMIETNPRSIFRPVKCVYQEEVKEINPLEYAINVRDTYMWKLILDKLSENKNAVEQFLQIAKRSENKINLEPLFSAYEHYLIQFEYWLKDEISDEQISNAWLELGMQQRTLLPYHMLKEFCREGNSWQPQSKFAMKTPSKTCQIFGYLEGDEINLLPFLPNTGLGVKFTLVRGDETVGHFAGKGIEAQMATELVKQDLLIFRQLYQIREIELNNKIEELQLWLAKNVSATYEKRGVELGYM